MVIAPLRTRALVYIGDRERMVDVLDTGRRRRLVIDGVIAKGERIWTLALVHVDGERDPRWIAVERLGGDEGRRERGKGAIPGYSLEGSERKRAHDRERRRRQRAEARAARAGGEA